MKRLSYTKENAYYVNVFWLVIVRCAGDTEPCRCLGS
jgi:hypothetical protein